MSVRRNGRGQWIYRKQFRKADGELVKIFGTAAINTRDEAEKAERAAIHLVLNPPPKPIEKKEVPTYLPTHNGSGEQTLIPQNPMVASGSNG